MNFPVFLEIENGFYKPVVNDGGDLIPLNDLETVFGSEFGLGVVCGMGGKGATMCDVCYDSGRPRLMEQGLRYAGLFGADYVMFVDGIPGSHRSVVCAQAGTQYLFCVKVVLLKRCDVGLE